MDIDEEKTLHLSVYRKEKLMLSFEKAITKSFGLKDLANPIFHRDRM